MRDRVPTQVLPNGAIRYEDFDAEGNSLGYRWTKRADEPVEGYEGTPYNVENILDNPTAEALGLDPADNPNPNDAFAAIPEAINKNARKIGDIIKTVRTDLGTNWLLCNGDEVNPSTYPDLYNLLTPNPFVPGWTKSYSVGSATNLRNICYGNGYWAVCYSSSTSYVRYTTDITATSWSGHSKSGYATRLKFLNGYFIFLGNGYLEYATDPSGTWTDNTPSGAGYIRDIIYEDGYYVAVGAAGMVWYTTDITGSWSSNTTNTGETNWAVGYGDSTWAVSNGDGYIYYSSTLNGTFVASAAAPGEGGTHSKLLFTDGYWVLSYISTYIKFANSLTASTWQTPAVTGGNNPLYVLGEAFGVLITCDSANTFLMSTSLPDELSEVLEVLNVAAYDIAFSDDYCGIVTSAGVYYKAKALPVIEPQGAYAYIKALE